MGSDLAGKAPVGGASIRGWAATLGVLAPLLWSPALAEEARPTLAGRWSASPVTVQWALGTWGEACGPQPRGGGEGAYVATVKTQGSELVFSGGRSFSTASCFEQYPGLNRVSHKAGARSWSSVCQTAPNDPRRATVRTTITATDDTISFDETGQYQFLIQGQNCTASTRRTRTYSLLEREGGKSPAASVTPGPPPSTASPSREPATGAEAGASAVNNSAIEKRNCQLPGPPARLSVSPTSKLMRPGDMFTFRASITDAGGCPLSPQLVRWSLQSQVAQAELTSSGQLSLGAQTPEGEIGLLAKAGTHSLRAAVQVVSRERYEALLSTGDFGVSGERNASESVEVGTTTIGAAAAVAEDRAGGRKAWFVGITACFALLLGGVGLVSLGKSRKAARVALSKLEKAPASDAAGQSEAAARASHPAPKVCPRCGTLYSGSAQFCGKDGTTLLPVN